MARARLTAIRLGVLGLTAVLAGCGSTTGPRLETPPTGTSGAASPALSSSSASASSSAPASTAAPETKCQARPPLSLPAGYLSGIQFVSPTRGWAVGQDEILATADGGQHWNVQDRGKLSLTSVDFISTQVGWAVGTGSLLTTTDGGAHWTPLPDPCVRSVHFVSASAGYAIAGGANPSQVGLAAPVTGGTVLTTTDGGRSWRPVPAPKDPQTVCFNTSGQGWLGAAGRLYRTSDGGGRWTEATAGPGGFSAGYLPTMVVQCAGQGSAWALDIGPGAASSQEPHVGYRAGPDGVVPLFAEQYFPHPGVTVRTSSPGSYAGPVSAISPSAAAFVDWCPACGVGTAPWDLVTAGNVTREGNVGYVNQPEAASFISAAVGWVVGVVVRPGGSVPRRYQTIVATDNGGHRWHIQYTGPPVRG